jgi:hypothetical protein
MSYSAGEIAKRAELTINPILYTVLCLKVLVIAKLVSPLTNS